MTDAYINGNKDFRSGWAAGRTAVRYGTLYNIDIGFGTGTKANADWRHGYWVAATTGLGLA